MLKISLTAYITKRDLFVSISMILLPPHPVQILNLCAHRPFFTGNRSLSAIKKLYISAQLRVLKVASNCIYCLNSKNKTDVIRRQNRWNLIMNNQLAEYLELLKLNEVFIFLDLKLGTNMTLTANYGGFMFIEYLNRLYGQLSKVIIHYSSN